MALLTRTQVGLKETGNTVTIPSDPRARLMYYLDCMCAVLSMDYNADVNRLRRYRNDYTLSHSDTSALIKLCLLLSPDELLDKCIFQNDGLCGNSGNNFYDLETVSQNLLIAGNVVIGGQNTRVMKIMTFKRTWLEINWINPMQILLERQERVEESQRQVRLAAIRSPSPRFPAHEQSCAVCIIL